MSAEHPIRIRAATPPDEAAFEMLLPSVGRVPVKLIAHDVAGRIVGAAALSASFRSKPPIGPGASVHVIPPIRRQGIGSALVAGLAETARQHGAEALYGMQRVQPGDAEEQGWRWLGFEAFETVHQHELAIVAIEERLGPILRRLQRGRRIPSTAEIIRLCDADLDAVADLHVKLLGGQREQLLAKLRCQVPNSYHPVYSRVLINDGVVVGCILAHRQSEDTAVVDANFLDVSVRGRWANIWLKLEATRGAHSLGIEKFVFDTFDHYGDTRKFTARLGGRVVGSRVLMVRRLGVTHVVDDDG